MIWILVSAATEAGSVSEYFTGTAWSTDIDDALLYREANGENIQTMRSNKGAAQQTYIDRDVRIATATVAITIGSVLS